MLRYSAVMARINRELSATQLGTNMNQLPTTSVTQSTQAIHLPKLTRQPSPCARVGNTLCVWDCFDLFAGHRLYAWMSRSFWRKAKSSSELAVLSAWKEQHNKQNLQIVVLLLLLLLLWCCFVVVVVVVVGCCCCWLLLVVVVVVVVVVFVVAACLPVGCWLVFGGWLWLVVVTCWSLLLVGCGSLVVVVGCWLLLLVVVVVVVVVDVVVLVVGCSFCSTVPKDWCANRNSMN